MDLHTEYDSSRRRDNMMGWWTWINVYRQTDNTRQRAGAESVGTNNNYEECRYKARTRQCSEQARRRRRRVCKWQKSVRARKTEQKETWQRAKAYTIAAP